MNVSTATEAQLDEMLQRHFTPPRWRACATDDRAERLRLAAAAMRDDADPYADADPYGEDTGTAGAHL